MLRVWCDLLKKKDNLHDFKEFVLQSQYILFFKLRYLTAILKIKNNIRGMSFYNL